MPHFVRHGRGEHAGDVLVPVVRAAQDAVVEDECRSAGLVRLTIAVPITEPES